MFRKLKKKMVLPIKWFFTREKKKSSMGYRAKEEIMTRLEDLDSKLLHHQRLRRAADIANIKGQIEGIKWIIYVDSESQGSSASTNSTVE